MTDAANDSMISLDAIAPGSPRIGPYRLIASLGQGGMADVHLAVSVAEATRFQKLLVVKLLKPELGAEPEFIEMFLNEARLAARLSHPNVVHTLEVGQDRGRYFIAMEYLEGQPLNRVLRSSEAMSGLDIATRLTLLLRALAGLDYAHELLDYDGTPLNVVHRDVSPGNILVGYDGQIKITDFGIAKARDSTIETRVGIFKGKTAYMAPEQAKPGSVDRRADVYSAGVILWELIVGRRMWQGLTQAETLSRVLSGNIPTLTSVARSVPLVLERICMKALALRREDRYPTAAALASDLESYLRFGVKPKPDREIGRLVASAFAADRARIRDAIEQELSGTGRTSTASVSVREGSMNPPNPDTRTFSTQSHLQAAPSTPPLESPIAPSEDRARARRAVRVAAVAAAVVTLLGTTAFAVRGRPAASKTAAAALAGPAGNVADPSAEGTAALPPERGVTPTEILLGMSAVFSGPNRQLGENMKLGLDTAFWVANQSGGVHGRKLTLVALDDGYEAARVGGTMRDLLEERKVFAVVGNVGTPTSVVAAPYASQHKTVFFGAFTGAPVLRQDPPDRYVFNYRASYREETSTMVRYLTQVQKLRVDEIVVFAQEDSFGDAGFDGVSKAVRALNHGSQDVLRVGYKRNTTDVDAAVAQVLKYNDQVDTVRATGSNEATRVPRHTVRAVVMVATYRAASKFIQKLREVPRMRKTLLFNVSFVGTEALADDLKSVNPSLCAGVHITQVVPPFDSGATGVRRYREALAAFQPQAQPGFVSLEGFIVGSSFVEALKQAGPALTSEKLVDTLEHLRGVDLGFGSPLAFSLSEHQGSHKVWGTRLDETCSSQRVDLE